MASLSADLTARPDDKEYPTEKIANIPTHFALNGKCYGEIFQANLVGNDPDKFPTFYLELYQREKYLPAHLAIVIRASRAIDNTSNPTNAKYAFSTISINAPHIEDFKVSHPGEYKLPEYFDLPKDYNADDKALVTFWTRESLLFNPEVPVLLNDSARPKLQSLLNDIQGLTVSKETQKYEILVKCPKPDSPAYTLLDSLDARIKEQKINNPSYSWSKDSPNEHLVLKNNIYVGQDKPPMSKDYRLYNRPLTGNAHWDLVTHVYAATDEHNVQVLQASEIGATVFKAAFLPVPGSAFKSSDQDNNLPKIIMASVPWDNNLLDRPKEGDVYSFTLPFDVPDCPEPVGEKKPQPKGPHKVDPSDDGVDESSGEWTKTHETNAEKNDAVSEKQHEEALRRRKIWPAVVMPPNSLSAGGQPMFALYRPRDPLWQGVSRDDAPTVGTVVPFIVSEINSTARLKDLLSAEKLNRQSVMISKVVHDRVYNDLVAGLNKFYQMAISDNDELKRGVLSYHLAEFMTNGNHALPYHEIKMVNHCCKDAIHFGKNLAKHQQGHYKNLMENPQCWRHGVALIAGVPASSKSYIMEKVAVAFAAKERADNEPRQQVLIVTDTNDHVNEWGKRLSTQIETTCEAFPDTRKLTIIRVHSLTVEKDMFMKDSLGHNPRSYFDAPKNTEYLVQNVLDILGQKAVARKKARDKRFDLEIANLDLHQAVTRELYDNKKWADFQLKLATKRDNPNDNTISMAELSSYYAEIQDHVLENADFILTTCSLACRAALANKISPILLIKDEDLRSPKWFAKAILANYETLRMAAFVGDRAQKNPHLETLIRPGFKAMFPNFPKYTMFEFLQDSGCHTTFLAVQYRMWNAPLVTHLSRWSYNGAMIDGNANKPEPAEVLFFKKWVKQQFNIDSNCVMIVVNGSYSSREDGSPSTVNLGMQRLATEHLTSLLKALNEEKEVRLDKQKFFVKVISPYLGVVNGMTNTINDLKDSRFSASSQNVVQGLGVNVIMRLIPNKALTDFSGEHKDDLVAMSRFKHGFLYYITKESVEASTYKFVKEDGLMQTYRTKKVSQHHAFFQKQGWIAEISAEDSRVCSKCKQVGHSKDDCEYAQACSNCYSLEHETEACELPKNWVQEDTRVCHACQLPGHTASKCPTRVRGCKRCRRAHPTADCTEPWCKTCKVVGHTHATCPKAFCDNCNERGHWSKSMVCPRYNNCYKCGQKHDPKYCTVAISKDSLFPSMVFNIEEGPTVAVDQVGDAEEVLHRETHPEAYVSAESTEEVAQNAAEPAQSWQADNDGTWNIEQTGASNSTGNSAQASWDTSKNDNSWETVRTKTSDATAQASWETSKNDNSWETVRTKTSDATARASWESLPNDDHTQAKHSSDDSTPITQEEAKTPYVQDKAHIEAQRQAADDALAAAFPNGYKMLPTSGKGLRCGIYAIQGSIAHQQPQLTVPTEEQLVHAALHGDTAAAMTAVQPSEPLDHWFHTDHLQGVLQDYGANIGVNFRLAVIYDTGPIFQTALEVAPDGPTYIIWVYHHPSRIGHYQAIAPL